MKITGVTIIKNAIINDYPIVEAIESILPVVNEMIVSIGDSEDETIALIQSINSPKIKIVHSVWDKNIRTEGRILAVETNKALTHVSEDTDWIFYIQGDEVIHEKYHKAILSETEKYLHNKKVEGLLFNYLNFYGTYDYVGDSRKWYNVETRIIRNNCGILSYRDAQGFRKNNQKINVAKTDAFVYHYGWVKSPERMKIKQKSVVEFWNDNDASVEGFRQTENYFNFNEFDALKKFSGTHPVVMKKRIDQKNWHIELDISKKRMKFKYMLLYWIEKLIGVRLFTFKNHKVIVR